MASADFMIQSMAQAAVGSIGSSVLWAPAGCVTSMPLFKHSDLSIAVENEGEYSFGYLYGNTAADIGAVAKKLIERHGGSVSICGLVESLKPFQVKSESASTMQQKFPGGLVSVRVRVSAGKENRVAVVARHESAKDSPGDLGPNLAVEDNLRLFRMLHLATVLGPDGRTPVAGAEVSGEILSLSMVERLPWRVSRGLWLATSEALQECLRAS